MSLPSTVCAIREQRCHVITYCQYDCVEKLFRGRRGDRTSQAVAACGRGCGFRACCVATMAVRSGPDR